MVRARRFRENDLLYLPILEDPLREGGLWGRCRGLQSQT